MKHKHYDMIVAWAEGKTVQNFNDRKMCWEDVSGDPYWVNSFQYRIKPEPKPDWFKRIRVQTFGEDICRWDISHYPNANLKLTFDGETGELKSAEVL
jgi:hypothetical protein